MDKVEILMECFKCKGKAVFKYKSNLNICANCFNFHVFKKKFRQNLRNQVDIIGKDNFIVAFLDGTLESVCMVHLLAENLELNAPALVKAKGSNIILLFYRRIL